jgi:hypothetical protein
MGPPGVKRAASLVHASTRVRSFFDEFARWVFHRVNTRFRLGLFYCWPEWEMIRKLAANFFVGTFVP